MLNHLDQPSETVIFLHIPKTAGTTLDQIIFRNHRFSQIYMTGLVAQQGVENFQNMAEADRRNYRLLKGHMSFGIHEHIPGSSAYFTFFRNPIERTISQFYFILRTPKHPIHDYLHENEMGLKECLEAGLDPMLHNGHTRLLSGVWAKLPPGECTEEHLEQAKANLSQVKVIGLTEQFDASLLMLGKAFGWNQLYYSRKNVTAGRPSRGNLAPETIAAVTAANQLDIKLYDYAKVLFAEQIKQQDSDFVKQVRYFKLRNRFARRFIDSYWAFRKVSIREIIRQQVAKIS